MAAAGSTTGTWWVVALCAEWCHVCRDWRSAFQQAAASHRDMNFAWVDIEDEADAMGDFDVDTFPTLLVARGDQPLFLGAVQPSPAPLARLLASLKHAQTDEALSGRGVSADAASLLARLQARVLPKP